MRGSICQCSGHLFHLTDEALIRLVQRTLSSEVFALLLERHIPMARGVIWRASRRVSVPRTLITDAIQEIPESLLDASMHFVPDGKCSPRTFLAVGVRRDLWNSLQQYRRYRAHLDRQIRADKDFDIPISLHARSTGRRSLGALGTQPSETVDLSDELDAVRKYVATLSPKERALGNNCLLADTPPEVFAEQTGVSVSTVKRNVRRLKAKLRVRFQKRN